MNITLSFEKFRIDLEKFIIKNFSELCQTAEVREKDIISKHLQPNFIDELDVQENEGTDYLLNIPRFFKKREILKYCILSWFVPFLTQFEVQEYLRRKARALNYHEIEIYLHSKELCAFTLYREYDYSLSDVFGNILKKGVSVIRKDLKNKKIRVHCKDFLFLTIRRNPIAIKPERKRGYDDHGSLPSESEKSLRITNEEYGSIEYLNVLRKRSDFSLLQSNRVLMIFSDYYMRV